MVDAVARAAGVPADGRAAGGDAARRPRRGRRARRWPAGRRRWPSFRLEVGRPVLPMLAQTARPRRRGRCEPRCGPAAVEWKLDGVRVQVHRAGDEVAVFTRSLDDITARVPEVVEAARALPVPRSVLDGEVIALRAGRAAAAVPGDRAAGSGSRGDVGGAAGGARRCRSYFFDVLHLDGADLLDAPGAERGGGAGRGGARARCGCRGGGGRRAGGGGRVRRRRWPRGHEGVVVKSLRRAVRGGPARRRLAQGEAAAHPRPGRARGRVGARPAQRLAVQPAPRRARPGDRRVRDARQDLQGADRRDAALADRAAAARWPSDDDGWVVHGAPGAGGRDRLRRRADQPALSRRGGAAVRPRAALPRRTRRPRRPTPSTPSARIHSRQSAAAAA